MFSGECEFLCSWKNENIAWAFYWEIFNDRAAESAEQDQTARMCMLILLYTVRKINPWWLVKGSVDMFYNSQGPD